jgi:hypothetical protein
MKYLFELLFLLLFSIPSFCQPSKNISNKPKVFELFSIGDSIQKFNNSLSCGDHSDDFEIVDLSGSLYCKVFQYLPAIKDPVDVGGVKFSSVLLFPDSLKFITTIDFNKIYLNTDTSINLMIIAQKDYNTLVEFITSFLQLKGKKHKEDHKKGEPFSGLMWLKDGNKYLLRKYDLAKRKKKVSQILIFEISKSN